MTLLKEAYGGPYFGDPNSDTKHKAGYSNYIELQCNWVAKKRYEEFLKRHKLQTTDKILELGGAVGYFKKVATDLGYNVTCVDWASWAKQNELSSIIEKDALIYLQSLANNSFDVIVSFALLECIPVNQLLPLYQEMQRVSSKQIHQTYKTGSSRFYNIKNDTDWKALLPTDTVIEYYG